jgi:hypothetical protein
VALERQAPRRKPKPKHSAIHVTVWSINGSPLSPVLVQKIERAIESEVDEERILMQVVRV